MNIHLLNYILSQKFKICGYDKFSHFLAILFSRPWKFKVVEEKCGEKKSDLSMVMTNDGV